MTTTSAPLPNQLPNPGIRSVSYPSFGEVTGRDYAEEYYSRFPTVERNPFSRRHHARYAVGLVGVGSEVRLPKVDRLRTVLTMPDLDTAVSQLRFDSYSRLGWIDTPPDANNGESDAHDAVSLRFGVVANTVFGAKMVGCSRLILGELGYSLPVENDYPDLFAKKPTADRATEISRMISMRPMDPHEIASKIWKQSPVKGEPRMVYAALQRVMIGVGRAAGYTCAYGMAEERLIKGLKALKVPFQQMTDYCPIPEYGNTKNAVIFVSPGDVEQRTRITNMRIPLQTRLFFRGIETNHGQGFYYDNNMIFRRPG